jgi:hypothetical protein
LLVELDDQKEALDVARQLGRRSRVQARTFLKVGGGNQRGKGSLHRAVNANLTRWVARASRSKNAALLMGFLSEATGLTRDGKAMELSETERIRLTRLTALAASHVLAAIDPSFKWSYGWLMQLAMRQCTKGSTRAAQLVQVMCSGAPSPTGLYKCAICGAQTRLLRQRRA